MIGLNTSIEEMHKHGLLSVRAMNACRKGGISTLESILKADTAALMNVRNCGKKTISEIDVIRDKFLTLRIGNLSEDISENTLEEASQISALDMAQTKYEYLHPSASLNLTNWTNDRYLKLSVRAKNAFPQLCNVSDAIAAAYSPKGFDTLSVKNCGKKTSIEIRAFLTDFEEYFEDATKDIDQTLGPPVIDTREKKITELSSIYPFLSSKECERIADFIQQNDGQCPYLLIAELYILRSDNPRIDIYRDYYGFNASFSRHSLAEIAENNNLSRERVRQIIARSMPLPEKLQEGVRQYLEPLARNIIAFDSLLWAKIQQENMLEETYSRTALLVGALLDTHTILQIDDEDKEYLVRKSIVENVKVRNTLYNIKRIVELRRTTTVQLDILQYITSEDRLYHKDVGQLCVIYANFLKRKYNVKIQENRFVTMSPNTIDIPVALENILERKGEPMSLNKLFDAFNNLYPSNVIDSVAKLKPYILRNKNIKPKSKTGIYVLNHWDKQFTGTLTDYLERILRSFEEPIKLDNLVNLALEEFPKTNKKSVYSLIVMDKNARFTIYKEEYIGLADKPAVDFKHKKHRVIKRQSFDTRFSDLKKFVTTMKRLPIQTGDEEEQPLARWMVNVLKSNIETTEEQLSSLHKFLDSNKTLPQDGNELFFMQMCNRVKDIVNRTLKLPNIAEHKTEYQWLRKNRKKYVNYENNRRLYFEDLLSWLKEFGFYL